MCFIRRRIRFSFLFPYFLETSASAPRQHSTRHVYYNAVYVTTRYILWRGVHYDTVYITTWYILRRGVYHDAVYITTISVLRRAVCYDDLYITPRYMLRHVSSADEVLTWMFYKIRKKRKKSVCAVGWKAPWSKGQKKLIIIGDRGSVQARW